MARYGLAPLLASLILVFLITALPSLDPALRPPDWFRVALEGAALVLFVAILFPLWALIARPYLRVKH